MSNSSAMAAEASNAELQDLVIESDSGARKPAGFAAALLLGGAFVWSLFQLWFSSPLPYTWVASDLLNIPVLNGTQARFFHLAFAAGLAFLAYPAFKKSPRNYIPAIDWVFAFGAVFCALYLYVYRDELALRAGRPFVMDVVVSIVGILILLEAARRALGPPLVIIASIFLFYTFTGHMSFMPEVIAHKGQTLNKVASHQWLSTEGVFGIAIGVSTDFVFLFVLFGAILEKAGAGNYFIKVAFSLLGHFKGGPAKAAVLSSAMTGLISGSSIANVVTTGTFTVPLMRKVGFSREKAGAVEVASSVNGQIMPPVMGAAAFLMVEYVGITYVEVVKHAFVPALISYIALLYIVHLEALKANMKALPKNSHKKLHQSLITFGIITSSILIVSFFVYYFIAGYVSCVNCADELVLAQNLVESGKAVDLASAKEMASGIISEQDRSIGNKFAKISISDYSFLGTTTLAGKEVFYVMGLKQLFGVLTPYIVALLLAIIYLYSLWYSAKFPPLEMDNPNSKMVKLPETGPTVKTGLHFILPIVVLVWCLMIERLSPGLSAFWATMFMIFIIVTQKPIQSFFRGDNKIEESFHQGKLELIDGLITGARNMIGIGIATAAAGIIVGSVSLTGVGQVMTELVEIISGGSFVLVLIFTAFICLILGMGLPTTANYIVVASLMSTVIVELGKQNGMEIPLIAVHLFVFYFGIMADVTPPVGLASFAAAAVSGGEPIRTGVQAFIYSIRTVILPFIFIYNTELLLIGVDSLWGGLVVFIKATIAILVFAAATQGYFIIKNKIIDTILLLLIAFALFRPGFWVDIVTPPYEAGDASNIEQVVGEMQSGQALKVTILGTNRLGDPKRFVAYVPVTGAGDGASRLEQFGIILRKEEGKVMVDDVLFNSKAEKAGFDFDFVITTIDVPQEQLSKNWVYAVAILLLIGVIMSQRSRRSTILSVEKA